MHIITIDSRYDSELLRDLSNISNPWGVGAEVDGWRTYNFQSEYLDAFLSAVENHDAEQLARYKEAKLAELSLARWTASQFFTYDGVQAHADTALTAVVSFVVAHQLMPVEGTSTWKLSKNAFREWGVADIIAYGIAIRGHIQLCFDLEAAKAAEILAATSKDGVDSVDVHDGWPT